VPATDPPTQVPPAAYETRTGTAAGLGKPKFELVYDVDLTPSQDQGYGLIPSSWNPNGRAGEDFPKDRNPYGALPVGPAAPAPAPSKPVSPTQSIPAAAVPSVEQIRPVVTSGPARAPPPPDHYVGPMVVNPLVPWMTQPKDTADYQIQLMNWLHYNDFDTPHHPHTKTGPYPEWLQPGPEERGKTVTLLYGDFSDTEAHAREYAGRSGYYQRWFGGK